MTDRVGPETRRRTMQAVRSSDTTSELKLRRALWKAGIRGYRVNDRRVYGTPDVCFPRVRVAVFVDGCFWHGCPQCYREPKSSMAYWRKKVRGNRVRDERVNTALAAQGWRVLRFWEHEMSQAEQAVVQSIREAVNERVASNE